MIKNLLRVPAALLVLLLFQFSAQSQLTLTNSPYTQDFNGIGSGLPTGWEVRTAATASALGTTQTLVTSATSWASTTGQFRNVAGAAGLTSSSSSTDQSNSSNRALGIRQTGSFGDPGGAFYLQLTNTTSKSAFVLEFDLQSLDIASPRTTTWTIQFGVGASPTSFTTAGSISGTLTTGNSIFSNNRIVANFGNQLDNLAGPVWIRIVTLTGSTGSGARATTGIDNVSISWAGASAPVITLSKPSIGFPSTALTTVANDQYQVSGANLGNDVSITTAAPYSISKDNTNFGTSLNFTPAQLASPQTVYVRFSPVSIGVFPGSIVHSSTGASNQSLTLSGEGFDPNVFSFNFNTCTNGGAPGSGFTQFSVTGAQVWNCTTFGRNSTNGVNISGFSGGAQTNEDWLISPALNLSSGFNIPVLSFYARAEFSGPSIQVLASNNYSGSGDPNLATWTVLCANLPAVGTNTWTLVDALNLSAFKTAGVYIAFKYVSSAALGAPRWTLDDVLVSDAANLFSACGGPFDFGGVSSGSSSASQSFQLQASGYGDITVNAPAFFEVSANNTAFSSSIVVPAATAQAGTTLYVRYSPTVKALLHQGTLSFTGTGLNQNGIAVRGSSFPQNETLDITTYNLKFFGSNPTNTATPVQIQTQLDNVTTVLQTMNQDLVAVQEVSNDATFATLAANLGASQILSPRWSRSFDPPDPNFPPQKIGFLYQSNLQLLSSRVMFEKMYDSARNGENTFLNNYAAQTGSPGPSSFWASGRLPFMAEFNATVNGVTKRFTAIVIHGKSGGTDLEDFKRRRYDVQALKDTLDAHYGSTRIVLLGDYNDDVVNSIFTGTVLDINPSPYSIFTNDAVNYTVTSLPLSTAVPPVATFVGGGSGQPIDHQIISNEFDAGYLTGSTNVFDPRSFITNYTSTTSDHLPVFSRFDLSNALLPVTGLQLYGWVVGQTAQLQWKTLSEQNSSHFVVERSADGRLFEAVGKVNAAGNSQVASQYGYQQSGLALGTYYYRLRQVDKDGRSTISKVVVLKVSGAATITLYPNPVKSAVSIALPAGLSQARWVLTTADGKQLAGGHEAAENMARRLQARIPALQPGLYLLQVSSNQGVQTIKFIKE